MILTCPECATRYFVPDESVSPSGRTVRCASCGNSWRAEPEVPLDLTPEIAAVEPPESEDPPAPAADDLPRAFRRKITARREAKKAMTKGAVAAAAGLAVIALLTLAILSRNAIARAWPESASAFAAVGLPVNVVGLVIEEQQAAKGFDDGRPAMLVTGALHNVTDKAVSSPPLRLSLVNGDEETVATKIASPTEGLIPAGERRYFAVRVQDFPDSVANVDITFELGDAAVAAGLRDRAPVDAEPHASGDGH